MSRDCLFQYPTHMTTVTVTVAATLSQRGHGQAAGRGLIGVPFDSGPRCVDQNWHCFGSVPLWWPAGWEEADRHASSLPIIT